MSMQGQPDVGPRPPVITRSDLVKQFWIDVQGKEVQSAETTSHSWMANQLAHIGIGMVFGSVAPLLARWLYPCIVGTKLSPSGENIVGCGLAALLVILWEVRAYWMTKKQASDGPIPIDLKLLYDNAVVAASYMVLGVALAFVYRQFLLAAPGATWWFGWPAMCWAWILFAVLVAIGIGLAIPWLRQKIIWQKAALPYLFRLANARRTMDADAAAELEKLVDGTPPPNGGAHQVIVAGPIGSGRTSIAVGIGTEFAFNKAMVRYLSFGNLLEFAAQWPDPDRSDDPGPTNIGYWRWSQSQVLVIDDIAPVLIGRGQGTDIVAQFKTILQDQLGSIAAELARCHTVWVIGDPQFGDDAASDEVFTRFARTIRDFCHGPEEVLMVRLERDPNAPRIPVAMSIVKARAPRTRTRYVR